MPRIDSDEEYNLSDSSEKRYFAKETEFQPTYGYRTKELPQQSHITAEFSNKEIVEVYEDSGLHWREVPLEVRFMRIVE